MGNCSASCLAAGGPSSGLLSHAHKSLKMNSCWRTTRVGGGSVAVVLHLLSPAKRAVQVTSDLAGFWERHYPQLRKEFPGGTRGTSGRKIRFNRRPKVDNRI